jgi:hypothetical protein
LSEPVYTTALSGKGGVFVIHTLTLDGQKEYARQLPSFPFAPGWGRLQSPIYYLQSWKMGECARAMVITTILLRCWLQRAHIKLNLMLQGEFSLMMFGMLNSLFETYCSGICKHGKVKFYVNVSIYVNRRPKCHDSCSGQSSSRIPEAL